MYFILFDSNLLKYHPMQGYIGFILMPSYFNIMVIICDQTILTINNNIVLLL